MQWVKRTEIPLKRPIGRCAVCSPVVTVRETAPVPTEQSNNPFSQVTGHRRFWWKHYTEGLSYVIAVLSLSFFPLDEFIFSILTQF